MLSRDVTLKLVCTALVLGLLFAGGIGYLALKPRGPQPLALAEGRLLGFGPDPHLSITVNEIAGVMLSSAPGVQVEIEVLNTAAGSFEVSPRRVSLALQDGTGSEVLPTRIVWKSGQRVLLEGDTISAREIAQGTAIFPVSGDFEPVELILWIDMGWAESIPLLKTSLLNPRLAVRVDTDSIALPPVNTPR